ncbi:hypothetical protein [Leptolyngbya sp. KIOST-1]|uniref:hypothetical protein n=1 Tax=Leptolyngbya sp. KIOST-1 TaxID=1229172 RepID=UPI00055C8DCB|nr:hypothetical protein [Leptolyngbya sp. KIOST-1]
MGDRGPGYIVPLQEPIICSIAEQAASCADGSTLEIARHRSTDRAGHGQPPKPTADPATESSTGQAASCTASV